MKYSDGTYSYILAPHKFTSGLFVFTTTVIPTFFVKYTPGCHVLIRYLTYTSIFYNIELNFLSIPKYCRSAGTFCILIYLDFIKDLARIQLPSGIQKIISIFCMATIGRASNIYHKNEFLTTAGFNRKKGIKPVVRGVAMNPVDHPHGGRTKTNSPEVTP